MLVSHRKEAKSAKVCGPKGLSSFWGEPPYRDLSLPWRREGATRGVLTAVPHRNYGGWRERLLLTEGRAQPGSTAEVTLGPPYSQEPDFILCSMSFQAGPCPFDK